MKWSPPRILQDNAKCWTKLTDTVQGHGAYQAMMDNMDMHFVDSECKVSDILYVQCVFGSHPLKRLLVIDAFKTLANNRGQNRGGATPHFPQINGGNFWVISYDYGSH